MEKVFFKKLVFGFVLGNFLFLGFRAEGASGYFGEDERKREHAVPGGVGAGPGWDDFTDDGRSTVPGFGDGEDEGADAVLGEGEVALLEPYLYLYDKEFLSAGAGADERLRYQRECLAYNNYPFSLPLDRVEVNTLLFSNEEGHRPGDALGNDSIRSIIQHKIHHFIVEGNADISQFMVLKDPLEGAGRGEIPLPSRQGYGFHFYGDVERETFLKGLDALSAGWSEAGSLAHIEHLDFALRGMNTREERRMFLETLGRVTERPALNDLKTLSLRFMELDEEDVGVLHTIFARTKKVNLERLILSFNQIGDIGLRTIGPIRRVIEDVKNFPKLAILDLKGNKLTSPHFWDLGPAIVRRGHHIHDHSQSLQSTLRMGFNGLGPDSFEGAESAKASLKGVASYNQDKQFTPKDAERVRTLFRKEEGSKEFFDYWMAKGTYKYERSRYAYFNLVDFLLLLRHGVGSVWKKVSFKHRTLEHKDLVSILKHLKKRDIIEVLNLDSAVKREGALDKSAHERLIGEVHRFNGLVSLDLSYSHVDGFSLKGLDYMYGSIFRKIPSLRRFEFRGNDLGLGTEEGALEVFLQSLYLNPRLVVLDLSHNALQDEHVGYVMSVIKNLPYLKYLDLSSNKLEFRERAVLEEFLDIVDPSKRREREAKNALEWVDISRNNMIDRECEYVIEIYEGWPSDKRGESRPILRVDLPKKMERAYSTGPQDLERTRFFVRQIGGAHTYEVMKARENMSLVIPKMREIREERVSVWVRERAEDIEKVLEALSYFRGIKDLSLRSNAHLGIEGLRAVAPVLGRMTELTSLVFSYSKLNAECSGMLIPSLKNLSNLTVLDFSANDFEDESVKILGDAVLRMPKLETLSFDSNNITSQGAKTMASYIDRIPNLLRLYISRNKIDATGVKALTPALKRMKKLKHFGIGYNNFKLEGLKELVPALEEMDQLEHLVLGSNAFGVEGLELLTSPLSRMGNLKFFHISGDVFGNRGCKTLVNILKNFPKLMSVHLDGNKFDEEDIKILAPVLENLKNLNALYIGHNKIGVEGARALISPLRKLNKLKSLYLRYSHLNQDAGRILLPVLVEMKTLEGVDLTMNTLDEITKKALQEALVNTKILF